MGMVKSGARVLPPADSPNRGGSRRLSDAIEGAAFGQKAPMYVMKVSEAIQLERLPTHEEAMQRGLLVEWKEGIGAVAFVSQTWLRWSHPDDADGSKCELLSALLQRAVAGQLRITPNWASELVYGGKHLRISSTQLRCDLTDGYVWFDIFSVPQADSAKQQLAIASIASYVGSSTYFFVLAGPWAHEDGSIRDVRAWLQRGWCRVEQISNALSMHTKPLIVAQSPSDVQTHGPGGMSGRMWLFSPVGEGDFTVDSDRQKLFPVLRDLVDARKLVAKDGGGEAGLVFFRVLHACKAHILKGLGFDVPQPATLKEWMGELGFVSAFDGVATGWTPLRLAVMAGRIDLATELLDLGADVEAPTKRVWQQFGAPKGSTILHLACYVRDDAAMARLLLARGADPRCRDAGKIMHALAYACAYGRIANIDALMAHDPSLSQLLTGMENFPFSLLSHFGQSAALAHVLAAHPEHVAKDRVGPGIPTNLCSLSVLGMGDIDTLRLLLDAGFSHELVGPCTAPKTRKLFRIADLMVRLRKRPPAIFDSFSLLTRCTALHTAAFNGNLGAVRLLLKRGADPASTNHSHGMTPLHLAAAGGHEAIVPVLLDAGSPVGARDGRKRTPAAWARRRGHAELAVRLERLALWGEKAAKADEQVS